MEEIERRIRVAPKPTKRWSLPNDLSSPPVCSVHPGRALELTTAIGVSKVKNSFLNFDPELEFGNIIERRDSFALQRSKLKSGRLRPLGLHTDPFLSSKTCLGVIPVDHQRKIKRSLTAPPVRPDPRIQRHDTNLSGTWDNTTGSLQNFRRACSANPNMMFEVYSRRLLVMNASNNLPQQQTTVASVRTSNHCSTAAEIIQQQVPVTDHMLPSPQDHHHMHEDCNTSSHVAETRNESSILPILSGNPKQEMKIEIRGKKGRTKKEKTGDLKLPLPDVHGDDSQDEKVPTEDETSLLTRDEAPKYLPTDEMRTSDPSTEQVKQYIGGKRRLRGTAAAQGRLSHGWSSPRPLSPLRGAIPPTVDTTKKHNKMKIKVRLVDPRKETDDDNGDPSLQENSSTS